MALRSMGRRAGAGLVALLAASLVLPAAVAAASPTYGFTLSNPQPATVNYSDLVTFGVTYTCVNGPDAGDTCPTSTLNETATFALSPAGAGTYKALPVLSASFTFTSSSSGCTTTCSKSFPMTWKAGRAADFTTLPPGTYDVLLTTSLVPDEEVVLPSGLVITSEGTTTTYSGATSGDAGDALALTASVMDVDRGLLTGTGIWYPDANLAASTSLTFSLYDATDTSLVAGPVVAAISGYGVVLGSPTLTLPAAGTYVLHTDYAGNAFYDPSTDRDTVTSNPVNTPPSLTVPGPITAEATSAAGAAVTYAVSATDLEDDPDPVPSCDPASGSTFPLGLTTVECSVTDSGGLTTTGSFSVTIEDTTDPTVSVSTAESAGSTGWYNGASNDGVAGLTVDVAASDLVGVAALSCTDNGLALPDLGPTGASYVLGDGSHAVSCSATDAAGNSATAAATFDVDQTPPTAVTFDGGALVDGASYVFGAVPDGPSGCTADDATSGLASCVVGGYSSLVGAQVVTATATDVAGNVATAELHYTVQPWTLVGFAKPIDMTAVNVEKAGRQLQLKFEVWAGATELTSPDVVAGVSETQMSCDTWSTLAGPFDAVAAGDAVVGTSGNKLAVVYVSSAAAGSCWTVTATTLDGSSLSARFRLR